MFTTFATLEASTDSKALNTSIGTAKIIVLDWSLLKSLSVAKVLKCNAPGAALNTVAAFAKLSAASFSPLDLVITAYNGGSGNVSKWLKNDAYSRDGNKLHEIPFEETKNYLEKVKENITDEEENIIE